MPKKVILDIDPGIDDAMALCLADLDLALEVVGVTAVGGNAARWPLAMSRQLSSRWTRHGGLALALHPLLNRVCLPTHAISTDRTGWARPVRSCRTANAASAEKVICDEVRAAPESVTIIALGPLTNIARAFQRDPELPSLVGQIVVRGGTVAGPGNITPAAEFNIYCDPVSARAVFRSHSTKVLIPLDVTNRATLTFDVFSQLPDENTKIGGLLRKILPYAFRAYRQQLGFEGMHIHDSVALIAAMHPELFTMRSMAGDVETAGEITPWRNRLRSPPRRRLAAQYGSRR